MLPREMKCGVQPMKRTAANFFQENSRIIGGEDAEEGGQPWTVSLQYRSGHICGGSIVGTTEVVTAAHCVYFLSSQVRHLTVVAGEYDRTAVDAEQQNISVSSIKVHPKYRLDGSMSYDVALIYLSQPITMGSEVQPICLPQLGEKVDIGTLCVSSGWGRVGENVELSDVLQVVTLPILDTKICGSVLDSMGLPALRDSMLCAGFPDGGKDACQGDSGGPLVCQRRSGTWFLAGTTSWGVGCGRVWGKSATSSEALGSPAIFARISAVLDFLRNSTADSGCSSEPQMIVDTNGVIKYPLDATSNYSSNSLCRWTVTVPEQEIIQIQFIRMNIEDHVTCVLDSLTFSVKQKMIRKVCGTTLPSPILIQSKEVTVTFFSDATINGGGFELKFLALPASSVQEWPVCGVSLERAVRGVSLERAVRGVSLQRAVRGVSLERAVRGVSLQWAVRGVSLERAACSGCGSVALLKKEEKIYTRNYPGLYPSSTTCRWVIEAPKGQIVQLLFLDFAVEFQEECLYDRVSVYGDRDQKHLIVTLCGFSVTQPVYSPGNIMVVVFKSDAENNFYGFKATFNFLYPEEIKPRASPSLLHVPDLKRITKSVCGVAPLSAQWLLNRIIGGEEACPNCWPWHVVLMIKGSFECSGAILSPDWVLTAAHCLLSSDTSLYVIIAGIHDRFLNKSSEQRRNVLTIAAHENFNPLTYEYDVGLLRVKEPFTFNDFVRPVCLPRKDEPIEPSSLCVVTGWGNTEEVGKLSRRLQQLQVPILNSKVCNTTYYPRMISKHMICAGFPDTGGKDTCKGDSGGPLVCLNTDNSYVVDGIVSWGVGCARAKKPGVYTRIRSFLSWIKDTQQGRRNQISGQLTLPEGLRNLRLGIAPSAGCPSLQVLPAWSGDLKSSGYPITYMNGLDCWWTLDSSSDHRIQIFIIDLYLKESPNCTWDALNIYDGASNRTHLLGSLCGNVSNLTLQSSGSHLTLHFHTDESVTGRRFHLHYSDVPAETLRAQETDRENGNCGRSLIDPMPRGAPITIPETVTHERGTGRMVGGHAATWMSWPWIASIQNKNGKHYCGAIIISERWLVTAAHCRFIVGSDQVFVGVTDLSQPERTEAFVKRTFTHDLYDTEFIPPEYDLRLLELETPLALGSQFPKILQQARVPLVSKEECLKFWDQDITEGNLCAGAAGASSCLGDSGGPLICKVKNKYELVGIVSWGSNICDPDTPAVYTSLAKYRDWIEQQTGV
ncbi:PREDICTED: ovochymase-1 [Nanorana parkeri]|uniref:ovochymase-1 n=1 Tax=Nanorana parkeri TaxID=125878 RepID=UPI000854BE9D|nr:PREDICTED: ovochymase-1 [Nanorana parkeri]